MHYHGHAHMFTLLLYYLVLVANTIACIPAYSSCKGRLPLRGTLPTWRLFTNSKSSWPQLPTTLLSCIIFGSRAVKPTRGLSCAWLDDMNRKPKIDNGMVREKAAAAGIFTDN